MDPAERKALYKEVRFWVLSINTRTPEMAARKFGLKVEMVELIIERGYSAVPWDTYDEYLKDTIQIL